MKTEIQQKHRCPCGKPTRTYKDWAAYLCDGCHKKDMELWAKQNGY